MIRRKYSFMLRCMALPVVAVLLSATLQAQDKPLPPITNLKTPDGVAFAVMGEKPAAPAPTLFVFASDTKTSLTSKDFNNVGQLLVPHGYICVSLDVPGHGEDTRAGEPGGISSWLTRLGKGENFVEVFTKRVSQVLDYLVAEKYTDPTRVAALGTSRGGFIALHCAIAEPRFKCVIAVAPVTRLSNLREFAGTEKNEAVQALTPIKFADKLAGRGVWMVMGNSDDRVGTEDCILLAGEIVKKSAGKVKPIPVELHIVGTEGHGMTPPLHAPAAPWLLEQLKK